MSAETLRRAAELMRERAEAANEGAWWGAEPVARALGGTFSPPNPEADAEHITSWHPAVALAVADWLDAEFAHQFGPTAEAIEVARAYLGEQP